MVIAVAIVVAVVAASAIALPALRRRARRVETDHGAESSAAVAEPPAEVAPPQHDDPPLTHLDDALHHVTDTSGTTIADRLDEEARAVDELKVGDDTGALLGRALDAIADHDDHDDGEPDGDETPDA